MYGFKRIESSRFGSGSCATSGEGAPRGLVSITIDDDGTIHYPSGRGTPAEITAFATALLASVVHANGEEHLAVHGEREIAKKEV